MKRFAALVCSLLLIAPQAVLAKKPEKAPKPPKQVKINIALQPAAAVPQELAGSQGVLDYKKNKGRTRLHSALSLPLGAFADAAAAAAAEVHMLIALEGQEPVDCKLALLQSEDAEIAQWHFKLNLIKNTPRARVKAVKGECAPSATMPLLESADKVVLSGYLVVPGAEALEFLVYPGAE